jgi:hypothetical protein
VALAHVLLFLHLLGVVSFFAGAAVVGTLQLPASLASGVMLLAILALMVRQPT